jgi:zinc transport system substrate-binding protein
MKFRAVFIYVLMLLTSCSPAGEKDGKPVISVSIIPQQYFIEQLAGDLVNVNVMIPPGASPATYEPTISQLAGLVRSVVYMRIGYIGFEQSWMNRISSVNPQMKIVDLSEGIEGITQEGRDVHDQHGHPHNGPDPHIWMSVANARIISRNILNELLILFPDNKEYLLARFDQFSHSLDSLNRAIVNDLQTLENRNFMIYHPALSYYARDYGLKQFPLEIDGKTPSPAQLRQMTDLAVQNHISIILIQSQFDRKNAELLSKETGAELIQFDPLALHWSEQMRYIAQQLNPSDQ